MVDLTHWTEWFGYAASVVVAVSLLMSNIRRLRWVNLAGSLTFVAYGALLGAWPVIGANLFIALIDIYYLAQLRARRDFYTLLPITGADPLARKFLLFHHRDILRFFPEHTPAAVQQQPGFFVLRNMLPVGVFFYDARPGAEVEVLLDYVIPEYRDHANAEFLFRILNEWFGREGHTAFTVKTAVKAHQSYLRREGFEEREGTFRRAII